MSAKVLNGEGGTPLSGSAPRLDLRSLVPPTRHPPLHNAVGRRRTVVDLGVG
jgi:hypothetical protein